MLWDKCHRWHVSTWIYLEIAFVLSISMINISKICMLLIRVYNVVTLFLMKQSNGLALAKSKVTCKPSMNHVKRSNTVHHKAVYIGWHHPFSDNVLCKYVQWELLFYATRGRLYFIDKIGSTNNIIPLFLQ